MSNILRLPQLSAAFRMARNADWVDFIRFPEIASDGTLAPFDVMDLSNIDFYAQVRPVMQDPNILLDLSTVNGGLINGGPSGVLSWHVQHEDIRAVPLFDVLNDAVMDILAVADGHRINLFQEAGPAAIEIYHGVTLLPG